MIRVVLLPFIAVALTPRFIYINKSGTLMFWTARSCFCIVSGQSEEQPDIGLVLFLIGRNDRLIFWTTGLGFVLFFYRSELSADVWHKPVFVLFLIALDRLMSFFVNHLVKKNSIFIVFPFGVQWMHLVVVPSVGFGFSFRFVSI